MREMIAVEVEKIGTMMPSPARSDGFHRLVAPGCSTGSSDAGPALSMEGAAHHRRDRRRTQRCLNFRIARHPGPIRKGLRRIGKRCATYRAQSKDHCGVWLATGAAKRSKSPRASRPHPSSPRRDLRKKCQRRGLESWDYRAYSRKIHGILGPRSNVCTVGLGRLEGVWPAFQYLPRP